MELDDSFKNMNVMVKRAVMASVLSSLPVFFNNTEEIQAVSYTHLDVYKRQIL